MNVFLVYAHPEPKSFNAAMKDRAVEVLRENGHEVRVSDLYAMGFNPVGGPHDFEKLKNPGHFNYMAEQVHATRTNSFAADVRAEQEKLLWADLILFQFPFWWFSTPAILKGWVDRVFAFGWAYGEQYALKGRKAFVAMTTGAPPFKYGEDTERGTFDNMIKHFVWGQLAFVGMEVLPPFVAWGVISASDAERREILEGYEQALLSLDTMSVLEFV